MEKQDISDWSAFCEGRQHFEPEHFSRMFMEIFVAPTDKDREDLRAVFSYVPHSAHTLDWMLRLCDGVHIKSDQELLDLVICDLREMRRIVKTPEVLQAMDFGAREITSDSERFRQSVDSILNREFHAAMSDYTLEEMYSHADNEPLRALRQAFYGIAYNQHLQFSLTATLLGCEVSFQNYFELYLRGGDYALDASGAVVMKYRTQNPESQTPV